MNDNEGRDLVLIQDRTVSGIVWDVVFCPNMELVAVIIDRNTVAIFRTTWERLATIPVCTQKDVVITCLAWSPDGANIVVGTSAPALAVYSVDRCASTATARTKRGSKESEPIISMKLGATATSACWSKTPSDREGHKTNVEKGVYEDRTENLQSEKAEQSEERWNGILLIGDERGELSIFSHNLQLTVASLPVLEPGFCISHIYQTESQRYCLVFGFDSSLRDQTDEKGLEGKNVVLGIVDMHTILDYWPEIDRIGVEAIGLDTAFGKLSVLLKKLREGWFEGALEVLKATIKDPLEQLMVKFSEGPDGAWQVLNDIYCGARITGAALQFLASDLSENGAKEALRSFRSHADDIEAAVMSALPIAETALFRASEYRGLARRTSRFAPVGVEFGDTDDLFKASENLYMTLQELAYETDQISNETEAFLAWLTLAASKAGGETGLTSASSTVENVQGKDAELTSKFFERWCPRVQPGSSTTKPADTIATMISDVIEPELRRFEVIMKRVASRPSQIITKGLSLQSGISLPINVPRKPYGKMCSSFQPQTLKDGEEIVFITIPESGGSFIHIIYSFGTGEWGLRRYNLDISDLCLQHVIQLAHDVFIVATGDSEHIAPDGKVQGQVALFRTSKTHNNISMILPKTESFHQTIPVAVPESTKLEGKTSDFQNISLSKSFGAISVCANLSLGVMW